MSENHFSKCDHCGEAFGWLEMMCATYTSEDGTERPVPGAYHSRCCDAARAKFLADRDLGDTPEHLKPLLRAAREEIPGTIVQDDGHMTPILWSPIRDHGGWYAGGLELQGYSLTTMHQSIRRRDRLQRAIEQGRCYPTADARRIGREEFGMVFEDEPKLKYDIKCTANAQEIAEALQEAIDKHIAHVAGGPGPGVIKSGSVVYKGRTVGPASTHRACACGSTTNVNLRLGVCAACHLEKRKAEVRAAMDRPVPKKCEESKAPRSWPADAGEDYEL